VRRVFASATSAPAYGYDPYGNALQGTAPLTDFNYAGMFYNADSGLYFTQFRAYDPLMGRWLSRDPIGETGDPAGNVYVYVGGNPIDRTDPTGLCPNVCQLPNGQIVPYVDLGNGYAIVGSGGSPTDLGIGAGVGNAANNTAMPTVDKPGGIAGGGSSGPVTSPASRVLRDSFGGARFTPLGPVTGTTSVGGAIARLLPIAGTALMAMDAAALLKAMESAPVCTPIL
jgi:RHS repeat-associated protein